MIEMKLTAEEQAMADGKYGPGTQLAMQVLIAIGEAYDELDEDDNTVVITFKKK